MASSPKHPELPLAAVQLGHLQGSYGVDRSKAILKYIAEFLPYVPNFQPIVGHVKEQHTAGLAGQSLFQLICPLMVQCKDGTRSVIVVNILFPVQFPERAPFAVLSIPTNAKVREDHPFVSQNGVVRLSSLPLLLNGPLPPYTLCEILLAVTDACEESFPYVALVSLTSSQQPAAAPTAAQPAAAAAAAPPTAPMNPPPQPSPRLSVMQAAEALLLYLGRTSVESYLRVREEGVAHVKDLADRRQLLEARLKQHEAERQRLEVVVADAERLRCMIEECPDAPAFVGHATGDDLVVPVDDLNQAALQLLSEILAFDDAMAVEEHLLRKSLVTPEEYIKSISDIARRQFISRYCYNRLLVEASPKSAAGVTPPATTPSATHATRAASTSPAQQPQQTIGAQTASAQDASLDPVDALCKEFPTGDRDLIADVWGATRHLPTARGELRALLLST